MFFHDRHKLSEGCTKCQKEEPSFKSVLSLFTIRVTFLLIRFNLYKGNVNDNIQLETGHLVKHLTFDVFLSSKRLQN